MKGKKEQALIKALEQAATENGYELVDVELGGTARARVIRVFIDKTGGLTIDDIAAANAWIDETVEGSEPFSGAYTLEVSSPGIDRPLRTLEHYARFVGEEAKLQTEALEGRGNWTGTLAGVEDDTVLLESNGETYRIPHDRIKKAHLKGKVDFKKTETERTDDVI